MWNRLKGGFIRFMYGRYGVDSLSRFLLWVYLILCIINVFFRSLTLSLLCAAVAVFMLVRIFSRNHLARTKENQAYLKIANRIKSFFTLQRDRFKDRKTHIYRACPTCKATLRLPRQKGEHTVRCPKCGNRFDVKVR